MRFLFGRPVLKMRPAAEGPRPFFILGAYPSALHVCWCPPGFAKSIKAIAVDNEPEPFWAGEGEADLIREWKRKVGFSDEWGSISDCSRFNGPSGQWVEKKILAPLGVRRSSAWITDCLDTYFESDAAARRLDAQELLSVLTHRGIPGRKHRSHPSEAAIVNEAEQCHRERLLNELLEAQPDFVVTLGNAALRVFGSLIENGSDRMSKLSPEDYGRKYRVRVRGRGTQWIPLAHPAAPKAYQDVHDAWVNGRLALSNSACN
jgi:hypothetical protein